MTDMSLDGPETYDVVVIGAGPAGENIAQYATEESGLTALLVEQELFGGECSFYACIPSKALLRPLEVLEAARHLGGVTGADLDVPALLRRRDEWVTHYDDTGQVDWARDAGLEVRRGHARLTGEREVTVSGGDGELVVHARHAVVLATGSEPVVPDLYAACRPWGSRDATGVLEVPDRLVVVGGGVVACEAAVWLRALGAEVTMLVRGERLLTTVEPFAAQLVLDGLRARGVEVLLGASVTACTREAASDTGVGRIHGGPVTVTVDGRDVVADEILVATGRRPRLDDLGLDAVGLTTKDVSAGGLPEWLLAVGDASGEAPLTHWGKYRARVLGEQLAERAQAAEQAQAAERAQADGEGARGAPPVVPVPQVVFTDPQVAAVGLTEEEAREQGHEVAVAQVPWSSVAGTGLLQDDAEGGAKLVVDARTHLLLGATFVGPQAAELVHAATVAIVGEVPTQVLRHAVPAYPTASELWLRLLEALPRAFRRGSPSPT